jgi:hypothetical protein
MSLPVLHPTAARRPDPEQEPPMTRDPRRRLALLLLTVCVAVALTAGVAIGAAGRGTADRTADESSAVTTNAAWPSLWPPPVGWSSDDDIISVRGKKCPRSHPKKLGSSSSSSTTQVNDGPVRRHSRTRSICSR